MCKHGLFIILFICLWVLLPQLAFAQACDETYGTSDWSTIETRIGAAADGTIICLSNGSYGTQTINDIVRTGYVTVKAENEAGASIGPIVENSDYIKFEDFTYNSITLTQCSTNIEFYNGQMITGAFVDYRPGNCGSGGVYNLWFEGLIFNDMTPRWNDGRFTIWAPGSNNAITIKDCVFEDFSSPSFSDGIQIVSGSGGVTITGNYFKNLHEGGGTHIDAIQTTYGQGNVTIENNYFENNTIHIGIYDGDSNMIVRNNVFHHGEPTVAYDFAFGGIVGMTMEHNTFVDVSVPFGSKNETVANSGWVVKNNIFDSSTVWASVGGQLDGCGADCQVTYNLLSDGGSIFRDDGNNITGDAIWIGTGSYVNWQNWELDSGSPGENAGDDSEDMGTTLYGSADPNPQPPGQATQPAPSNTATDVSITETLVWVLGADTDSVDLYFDDASPLGAEDAVDEDTDTTYDPGTLSYNTTHYWRVDPVNTVDTTTGVEWSFTTEAAPDTTPPTFTDGPNPSGEQECSYNAVWFGKNDETSSNSEAQVNYVRANPIPANTVASGYNEPVVNALRVYVGTQNTSPIRMAVYEGGTVTDPTGATLIFEGLISSPTANSWNSVSDPDLSAIDPTSVIWVVVKGNDTNTAITNSSVGANSEDFYITEGRFESDGAVSSDEAVAFPATWPSDAGTQAGYWYDLAVEILDASPLANQSIPIWLETNENATVRYCEDGVGGCTSSTTYDTMGSIGSTFDGTGTQSHTDTLTSLSCGGSYDYWVRAQDTESPPNQNPISTALSFTISGDTDPPIVINVNSDKADGTYDVGEVIDIDVTFNEAVTSTGDVTVTLETGEVDRTCTFTVTNETTKSCNYTVEDGDTSADLTVLTVSGTVVDQSNNAMVTHTPQANLAANKAIVINTITRFTGIGISGGGSGGD